MAGIRKILVAIDGSDHSRRAVGVALDLARASDAKLTLLQVRESIDGQLAFYGGIAKGEAAGPPAPLDVLKAYPQLKDVATQWEAIDEIGHPADKICEVVKRGGYDLAVVGSRGASPVSRFFLGSVSDRVVHHAEANVLVVK